jgi:hypothetical protein
MNGELIVVHRTLENQAVDTPFGIVHLGPGGVVTFIENVCTTMADLAGLPDFRLDGIEGASDILNSAFFSEQVDPVDAPDDTILMS